MRIIPIRELLIGIDFIHICSLSAREKPHTLAAHIDVPTILGHLGGTYMLQLGLLHSLGLTTTIHGRYSTIRLRRGKI